VYLGPIELPCPDSEKDKKQEENPKMQFKEPEPSVLPPEESFLSKNANLLIFIATLIFLFIFRSQVVGIVTVILSATKTGE
jgi:hypothetical protein